MKFIAFTGRDNNSIKKSVVAVKSDEMVYIEIGEVWANLSQKQVRRMMKSLWKHYRRVRKRDEMA